MNLEETPGLTDAERAAVAAYEEAHRSYAASVMGERFKAVARAEHEAADRIDHAIERVEETYSRLSNPRVLQEILGHSRIDITLNTYTHVLPHVQTGSMQRFRGRFYPSGKEPSGSR